MADTTGEADLRAENVNPIVTGFALRKYMFKGACLIQKSSSWKETYWSEGSADLTGGSGEAIEGVPRGADFPHIQPSWTEASKRHVKHGGEAVIDYEDKLSNDIDVISRTLLRVARAIAKSVDTEIWDVISESRVGSLTNKVTITAGHEWNSDTITNRDPIDNLLEAQELIVEDDYDPYTNTELWLTPKDFRNLLNNPNVKNTGQFWTSDPTKKGKVGMLLNMIVVVSNNVTDDWAAVVIKKEACTWLTIKELSTVSIEDEFIKTTIRSCEIGQAQLKNPNAVCLISNTQKT